MEEKKLLEVFTDGSSNMNSLSSSAYAFCIDHPKKQYCDAKSMGVSTSNGAELTAVLESIKFIERMNLLEGYDGMRVNTDSMYIVKGATKWLSGWKHRNWMTVSRGHHTVGKEIANKEMWQEMDKLLQKYHIEFVWVRGHDGNQLNELCDTMAKKAIRG